VDAGQVVRVGAEALRAANGSPMKVVGKKVCQIRIASSTASIEAYIVDELTVPCILGVDGLKALRVVLNFHEESRQATLDGVQVASIEEASIGPMSDAGKRELRKLLEEYQDLFQEVTPGAVKGVVHRITTIPHQPIVCKQKRVPLLDQQVIEEHVKKMLQDGVISPSHSPYRSSVVIADKKNGEKRFCVNFCRLNDVTVKNRHPLPRIDDLMDRTRGSKIFTVLDMSSAYWQVPLAREDRPKTAFSTGSGHYEFNVMPFGLCNAPATQQESMRRILQGIEKVEVLLDDVIVHEKEEHEKLQILRKVFQRFRENNVRLKRKKCHFMKPSVRYCGHVAAGDGWHVDPDKSKRSPSILFQATSLN
jgi:hypothetical protein